VVRRTVEAFGGIDILCGTAEGLSPERRSR